MDEKPHPSRQLLIMPDLIAVAFRRWRLIATLSLTAAAVAFIASLLSPKLYLATATALPANSATTDRARIFGANIEALYPELGEAEELDKLEGTAQLDTVYIAASRDLLLGNAYDAAMRLKSRTDVRRTGYGELQIRVWDEDKTSAAALANALMQHLNDLHRRARNANNKAVLAQLATDYQRKRRELDSLQQQLLAVRTPDTAAAFEESRSSSTPLQLGNIADRSAFLVGQLKTYERLIDEYELAANLTTNALTVIEPARPAPYPDRPRTLLNALLAFAAGLLFASLLAVFLESRTPNA